MGGIPLADIASCHGKKETNKTRQLKKDRTFSELVHCYHRSLSVIPAGATLGQRFDHLLLGECLAEEASMTDAPADIRSPGGFGRLGSLPLVVIRRGIKLPESELTGHRHTMTIAQIEQRQKDAQERLAGLSTACYLSPKRTATT